MSLAKLADPFEPSRVSWRIGQIVKDNPSKASALCYIDARDVMDKLDQSVGPENWSDSYEVHGPRVICTIRIKIGDEWVGKSDGAGDTQVEGEKGAISDAFKRAAVKWGIGRYLYEIPVQYVAIDPKWKKILPSEFPKLQRALPGSRLPTHGDEDDAIPVAKPSTTPALLVETAKGAKETAAQFVEREARDILTGIRAPDSIDKLDQFMDASMDRRHKLPQVTQQYLSKTYMQRREAMIAAS